MKTLQQTLEDLHKTEEQHRAKWTQATREAYHKESPENFAGPDMSFPIKDGSDVGDAWGLAGHADSPDAVRSKIKAIAKRLGLEGSLPDTAKEDDKQERAMAMPGTMTSVQSDSPHPPHTGRHSHNHPHSDGYSHEHDHEHSNDNHHDHAHTHAHHRSNDGSIQAVSGGYHLSFPITRSDPKDWTVYGRATVEQPDNHGTIFSYEGAKKAFEQWPGNIREQHDKHKAVGRRIDYEFNDDDKSVNLFARVSKGAPDTWEKVLDGTLSDFSVNVIPHPKYGNDISRWPKKEYQGRMYPYLPEYSYAEISLVDYGSAPGTQFSPIHTPITRADGSPTDILAVMDSPEQQPLERAGTRVSSDTMGKMHTSIGHTLRGAMSQMDNCGCDDCKAAMKMIDPDGDGDIDLGGYDDPDQDWKSLYDGKDGDMERTVTGLIEKALQPVYNRLQSIAGTFARANSQMPTTGLESIISGAITRAVEATSSQFAEVRAELSAVKEQVTKIADTPMPGAPIQNLGVLPQPTDKQLATTPTQTPVSQGAIYDAMRTQFQRNAQAGAYANGAYTNLETQIDDMARVLAQQPRR